MSRLADAPEALAQAAKFAVPPEIHADDFIYEHHLAVQTEPDRDKARAHVIEYYFFDGDRSAQRLDALIRQFLPDSGRLGLLEFASGYGCVSRHLQKLRDRYDLVACDIHPQAIDFLHEKLGVSAVLSHSRPQEFDPGRTFDVVFALSFFSHMPDRTFGDWIQALFATLTENGLLIFTTHGRQAHIDTSYPTLDPAGYWFAPMSEQKDIPTDEYGCMVSTPFYVLDHIARCPQAALVFFQEAFWWGKQDLYIVRKVATEFRPQSVHADLAQLRSELHSLGRQAADAGQQAQQLRDAIDTIRSSTSWRITRPVRVLGEMLKAVRSGSRVN